MLYAFASIKTPIIKDNYTCKESCRLVEEGEVTLASRVETESD